jgi:hypothetical protein
MVRAAALMRAPRRRGVGCVAAPADVVLAAQHDLSHQALARANDNVMVATHVTQCAFKLCRACYASRASLGCGKMRHITHPHNSTLTCLSFRSNRKHCAQQCMHPRATPSDNSRNCPTDGSEVRPDSDKINSVPGGKKTGRERRDALTLSLSNITLAAIHGHSAQLARLHSAHAPAKRLAAVALLRLNIRTRRATYTSRTHTDARDMPMMRTHTRICASCTPSIMHTPLVTAPGRVCLRFWSERVRIRRTAQAR